MKLDHIKNTAFSPLSQTYDKRDTILYALGLGFGRDPMNEDELPFVYEKALKAVPSFCNNLCHPGFWAKEAEFGINWVKILHAEQELTMHAPMPATGTMKGSYKIIGIEDKGTEKGALLHQEKYLSDAATGTKIATVRSTLFLRGDGGQGGFGASVPKAEPLPQRTPDRTVYINIRQDQALLYRLSGDWNPLHAEPAIAKQAGFKMPILHGLCTNGLACRALLETYCNFDPEKLKSLFLRFSSPVYPGETIRFDFYEEDERLRFKAVVSERDVTVLDRCSASFHP